MLFMFADQQAIGVALIVAAISFFVITSIGIAKIRVLVIEIAQWCAVLSLALSTAAGSIAGYQFGASIQATYQSARPYAGTLTGLVCAAIGGLAALVVAAIPFSIIFLLADISINTRHEGARSNATPVASKPQMSEFERRVAHATVAVIISFVALGIIVWLTGGK